MKLLRVAFFWTGRLALVACFSACSTDHGRGPGASAPDAGDPVVVDDAEVLSPCESAEEGESCGPGQYCRAGHCETNWCGDGVRAGSEFCDDGNKLPGDGCDPVCRIESSSCGDGKVVTGEECDDGNWIDSDACSNACTFNRCGNGRVDHGEECDDGNTVEGDECANSCVVWECRNGRVDPNEECDDGNTVDRGDGCTNSCELSICGNGKVEKHETCDDGNRENEEGGGCPANCNYPVCGNGLVEFGEACEIGLVSKQANAPVSPYEGAPAVYQGCSNDCRKRTSLEEDDCGRCLDRHCRSYLDVDLLEACFVVPNADIAADLDNLLYIQHCVDIINCALTNHCGVWDGGAVCYCGSSSVDDCSKLGPAPDAPCVKEWQAGAKTMDNTELLTRFSDPTFPLGVAYTLLQCLGDKPGGAGFCARECDGVAYCARSRDPAHCDANGKPRG